MTEPTKTAIQILRENASVPSTQIGGVLTAMKEYTEMEVAAERERIKEKVKKFQPDFDKAESYQHGFHDAIQVLIDNL